GHLVLITRHLGDAVAVGVPGRKRVRGQQNQAEPQQPHPRSTGKPVQCGCHAKRPMQEMVSQLTNRSGQLVVPCDQQPDRLEHRLSLVGRVRSLSRRPWPACTCNSELALHGPQLRCTDRALVNVDLAYDGVSFAKLRRCMLTSAKKRER